MAMNGSTPAPQTALATPVTPPAPTSPAPVASAPASTPATVSTPEAPKTSAQTLLEVVAARRAALQAGGQAPTAETQTISIPTTPETPAAPQQPQTPEAGQTPPAQVSPQEQLFNLFQNNPQQLMAMLQAVQPQQTQPQQPAQGQTDGPNRPTVEQYSQTIQQEIQQHLQSRQPITAEGLFGADNAEEMGLKNVDFTADLESFVHATVAPVIGNLLVNLYNLQHHFDQQFQQVQPVLSTHQLSSAREQAAAEMRQAFPALATGDRNAIAYADRRFAELAPLLAPPELLQKPESNPQEYARIMTAVAKIAASEYSNLPPATTPVTTPATPQAPATVTPEPQQVPSTYRNHLGQFKTTSQPRTLDAFNQQRLEKLFSARS